MSDMTVLWNCHAVNASRPPPQQRGRTVKARAGDAVHPRKRARRLVETSVPEDDPRYRRCGGYMTLAARQSRNNCVSVLLTRPVLCRIDLSEVHAFEARRAFSNNIAQGEAALNVAEAALQIAAEDDAIVSHSTVRLPIQVDAFCHCSSNVMTATILFLHCFIECLRNIWWSCLTQYYSA